METCGRSAQVGGPSITDKDLTMAHQCDCGNDDSPCWTAHSIARQRDHYKAEVESLRTERDKLRRWYDSHKQVIRQLRDELYRARRNPRCPEHNIPDCSPLLNGCTWRPDDAVV